MCKACGTKEAAPAAATAATTSRIAQYQLQFARDLDPTSPNAPATLGELCERLKGWRVMLETIMEDLYPSALRLENESAQLVDMSLEDLEMPCQPLPSPDSPDPVYIEKVGSRVDVVRRNCTSARRIILHGSDGSARAFCIVGTQSHVGVGLPEERINALLRGANSLLDKHPESRRRGLRFVAPQGLAIYPGWCHIIHLVNSYRMDWSHSILQASTTRYLNICRSCVTCRFACSSFGGGRPFCHTVPGRV